MYEVALIVTNRVQNAVPGCNLKNDRTNLVRFQGKPSKSMPQSLMPKKIKLNGSMKTYIGSLELTPKKDVLFITVDWNAKVGSQDIPVVTGKFGLGVQNEAKQRLTEFCQENALVRANTLVQQHMRQHGHHQLVNTKSDVFYSLQMKMKLYTVSKNKTRS